MRRRPAPCLVLPANKVWTAFRFRWVLILPVANLSFSRCATDGSHSQWHGFLTLKSAVFGRRYSTRTGLVPYPPLRSWRGAEGYHSYFTATIDCWIRWPSGSQGARCDSAARL